MSDYLSLVPSFIIYLNGERLPIERETLVSSIIVTQNLDVASRFELNMKDPDATLRNNIHQLVGAKIKILIGYKDAVQEVIHGEVTGIHGHFSQVDGVSFDVLGGNYLHRLKGPIKTRTFNDRTYSEILSQIADEAGLASDIDDIGPRKKFAAQRDLGDLEFMQTIASKYNCFIWEKDKTVFLKRIPPRSGQTVVLENGKTLKEFSPG